MARKQPRLQADADTQTDTHIMAPYIDKDYEWNEWEMRRKGTFMIELNSKFSFSYQTGKPPSLRHTLDPDRFLELQARERDPSLPAKG